MVAQCHEARCFPIDGVFTASGTAENKGIARNVAAVRIFEQLPSNQVRPIRNMAYAWRHVLTSRSPASHNSSLIGGGVLEDSMQVQDSLASYNCAFSWYNFCFQAVPRARVTRILARSPFMSCSMPHVDPSTRECVVV